MFRIFDTFTGDILDYESIDEFQKVSKFSFDNSTHDAIDEMCDAYKRGDDISAYETYLGIAVVTDYELDVYDLIEIYR